MEIGDLLLRLGIKPNSMGYRYLCDIIAVATSGVNIFPLNTVGYRFLAEKYANTVNGIEKNIQNCINTAWLNGNPKILYEFFGETINDTKGKPTNKHLICAVCEKLGSPLVL